MTSDYNSRDSGRGDRNRRDDRRDERHDESDADYRKWKAERLAKEQAEREREFERRFQSEKRDSHDHRDDRDSGWDKDSRQPRDEPRDSHSTRGHGQGSHGRHIPNSHIKDGNRNTDGRSDSTQRVWFRSPPKERISPPKERHSPPKDRGTNPTPRFGKNLTSSDHGWGDAMKAWERDNPNVNNNSSNTNRDNGGWGNKEVDAQNEGWGPISTSPTNNAWGNNVAWGNSGPTPQIAPQQAPNLNPDKGGAQKRKTFTPKEASEDEYKKCTSIAKYQALQPFARQHILNYECNRGIKPTYEDKAIAEYNNLLQQVLDLTIELDTYRGVIKQLQLELNKCDNHPEIPTWPAVPKVGPVAARIVELILQFPAHEAKVARNARPQQPAPSNDVVPSQSPNTAPNANNGEQTAATAVTPQNNANDAKSTASASPVVQAGNPSANSKPEASGSEQDK